MIRVEGLGLRVTLDKCGTVPLRNGGGGGGGEGKKANKATDKHQEP